MSEIPTPPEGSEDVDEQYRRLSDRESSAPRDGVRRAVLRHAATLAAEIRTEERRATASSSARASRWRVATYGGLAAAAALTGLWVIPQLWTSVPPPVAGSLSSPSPPNTEMSNSLAQSPPAQSPPAQSPPAQPPLAQSPPAQSPRAPAPAISPSARALEAPPAGQGSADAASARALALPRAQGLVNPQTALREAARRGDLPAIHRLLAEGLDVNARDAGGRTALMWAVLQGQREAVETLLSAGADPNAADTSGTTPLQAALAGARPAIATALERSGAR